MTHGIHRVTAFEIKSPHTLRVEFEDGVSRTIDFTPILEGDLYGPLRDPVGGEATSESLAPANKAVQRPARFTRCR